MNARTFILAGAALALISFPAWGDAGMRTTLILLAYHATLAGMWNLLAIIDALEQYTLEEIGQAAQTILQTLGLENDYSGFKERIKL